MAWSPQQHIPNTVGPFYLTTIPTFPVGGKLSAERRLLLFSHQDWVRIAFRKFSLRLECGLKGERQVR